VVGQVGVTGSLVVNPVELVFRNTLGVARNLRPVMAGNLAMEKRGKAVGAIQIPALLMVVGQAGARGRLVVNPVDQVLTSVLGAARNLRPNMAAKRAMEIRGKVVSAT